MEKQKLLKNRKEWLLFLALINLITTISLIFEYRNYLEISKFTTSNLEVLVLNQYRKKGNFILLMRSSNGFEFYTVSKEKIRDLRGYKVDLVVQIPVEFSFLNYLSGTFLFHRDLELSSETPIFRYRISQNILELHPQKIGELYSALFLATPVGKELREDLTRLGVNHLAVLSGFHISFILGTLFLISKFLYFPLHKRYFPYRNRLRDTLLFSLMIAVLYLIFLDFPPSFFRAVGMAIVGFLFFDRNILKAPFETLGITVLILLAFQPKLFFSIGFWFSVSGVYYIILYLQLFKFGFWDLILINLWVFFAMIPIVHFIFPEFYFSQLLSPIWTILFLLFYPLSALLHTVGFGDLLNPILELFLEIELGEKMELEVSIYVLVPYIIFSLLLSKISILSKLQKLR
jgi:competence protein ComEC